MGRMGVGVLAVMLLAAQAASAQVKIGAILSITGPTAAQGVGYKNAFQLFPAKVAGQDVTYIVRDDGGDPAAAVDIARKMITEDHVDAIIGPSLTGSDLSVQPIANDAHVPFVAMAPIVFDPKKYPYTFDDAQPASLMIDAVVQHMVAHGQKTVAFIGYSDGWGDQVLDGLKASAAKRGVQIVDEERYARTDTTVEAQVLKAMIKHPAAMMLGGSATPGALPNIALTQRGYKGQVYNNHGVVSDQYIKVGGAAVEGCIAPTGPLVVYDQLPDSNPVKKVATDFMTRYIAAFGPQSRNAFAGYSEDAFLLISNAIPAALQKGQPGTEAFRVALRDAIENTHELVGTHGVYNMTPDDHHGVDDRARVLVQVTDGAWKLIE
jgi:branched-chain amino acid transport system substrate-binding protein